MLKFHVNKRFKENKELCRNSAEINKVHSDGNRRKRRISAALKRRAPSPYRDPNYWYKRIIGEMKECKQVQDLVISGKVDRLLE